MRVLVTGASGFVGIALCRELLARGHAVVAAVRKPDALREAPAARQVLVPDLAADLDRRALLEGIEVVVHLAAIAHRGAPEAEIRRVNVDATIRLAESAAGAVRRFVFMSSVKVHGEDSGEGSYVETSPTRPQDAYGRSKLEAERLLGELAARHGLELTLVRPPLVYGPGVRANFLRLLRWVDSGLPLPFASLRNRRRLIYLGNLVSAVVRCVERAGASGPFLLGDDEIVSTPELLARIARALERPVRLFPVPPAALRLAGAITGRGDEIRRLTGNLVTDTSRARSALDWRPPHSLDEGLAQTARWLRSSRG
jgi:nucleoside-diphosphate-sugar epimerase